jgi:hypothetical protein
MPRSFQEEQDETRSESRIKVVACVVAVKTIPGKGWFTYFRLYGPTQPYFDRSWVLPDIEEAK